MRNRLLFPALLAVLLVAAAAFIVFNPVTPVSAQQIIERAAAAQSAAQTVTQGIWHIRTENYDNPQALVGNQAGAATITDDYNDLTTGYYRKVTQDVDGKVQYINAFDGSFFYWLLDPANTPSGVSLAVTRAPVTANNHKGSPQDDPASITKAIFEQFRNNPRVKLEGKITWADGSPAYVLVNENYQGQQQANGQTRKTLTGATKMIFHAQTYQLLESQTIVHKDGKDIVLQSTRYLVNEILPTGEAVAWNLSDIQGIAFIDEPVVDETDDETQFRVITEQELAQISKTYSAKPYLLHTVPTGYTQEIILVSSPADNPELRYEVHYTGTDGATFELMAVGFLEPGFIEKNFYDGSYKTKSGLVLNYTPSEHDSKSGGTAAMLTTPDGISFLVHSSLPRVQVEALVEDLAPVR